MSLENIIDHLADLDEVELAIVERQLHLLLNEKETSLHAIEQYVHTLLQDTDVNIALLPDCIEKKLYSNTIKILVSLLYKVLKGFRISLFNHTISLVIYPNLNKIEEIEKKE